MTVIMRIASPKYCYFSRLNFITNELSFKSKRIGIRSEKCMTVLFENLFNRHNVTLSFSWTKNRVKIRYLYFVQVLQDCGTVEQVRAIKDWKKLEWSQQWAGASRGSDVDNHCSVVIEDLLLCCYHLNSWTKHEVRTQSGTACRYS